MFIRTITGGNICYEQPVNYIGLFIAIIIGLFLWDITKYLFKLLINYNWR